MKLILLPSYLDNIAVSVFVVILVDLDKYRIWDEQACLILPAVVRARAEKRNQTWYILSRRSIQVLTLANPAWEISCGAIKKMAVLFLPQNNLVSKCNRVNEAENEMLHMLKLHKFEPTKKKKN